MKRRKQVVHLLHFFVLHLAQISAKETLSKQLIAFTQMMMPDIGPKTARAYLLTGASVRVARHAREQQLQVPTVVRGPCLRPMEDKVCMMRWSNCRMPICMGGAFARTATQYCRIFI